MAEQEAESASSLDGDELLQQASGELHADVLTVCEERDPKQRRELLMCECRKWWHALLDKDKWIRDQDQGLVNRVVVAIQRQFPELTVPAIRAIIARSMRKAREKTKNANSKANVGAHQEGSLKLSLDGSPTVEVLRMTKLPQMSDSATTSSEEETEASSEEGGGKRKSEVTPWLKMARVKTESFEGRKQSPGPSGRGLELPGGGLPSHLRLPYEIPPAPRFNGGPSLASRLNLPSPPDLNLNSWVAAKTGAEDLLASLSAPSNSPPLASASFLPGTSSKSMDETKQRLITLELRVRAQEAQIAQFQAKETSWQAEKLSFEWHIQKLEQAEMCARESIGQVKAHAENLERELHLRTLANNELEHQMRSILTSLRGSVYDRPRTPQFGDLSPSDQQKLLPALLLAYQKMSQGGHVTTAHMAQSEGEKESTRA